ncbi:MAG TPA: fructose-bisphosphatase class II, partial [bacterium]|nr:fructose-bisphosphatase class II [bacterium]
VGWDSPLSSGQTIGTGEGPKLDVVVDPIDGRRLLAQGRAGAIAVAGAAPYGSMWSGAPAVYMEKIVVSREAAHALVPECMDAPAAWTLALVAREKEKRVEDLTVFVLERTRHAELVEEIRKAGARVMLRTDGDIAGAVMAASSEGHVDVLMGIGGVPQGVIAACAVKSMGGAMLGRLRPQRDREKEEIEQAGLDTHEIMDCDRLVSGDQIYFAITGITDGPILHGVHYHGNKAETNSLILRCETGTRRTIFADHLLE